MAESLHTRQVSAALRRAGALVVSIVGGPMQRPGLPDRLVIHRAFSGFIEAKLASGKLSTAQQLVRRECLERGFPHVVMRYLEGRYIELSVLDVVKLVSDARLDCEFVDGKLVLRDLARAWSEYAADTDSAE